MTERENALNTILHGKPQWVPCRWKSIQQCGHSVMKETGPTNDLGQRIGGLDCWGVNWILTGEGTDAPTPDHNQKPILEDVTEWREKVRFPDVEGQDWEGGARWELRDYTGDKLLVYFDTEGLFNRMTDLMGYENALCAFLTDPEDCYELIGAIADHKIRVIEHAAKYYHPDVFSYMDDFASATGPMISPETYRALFKPHHARVMKAIRENGMIVEQHICGKWDVLIDDFMEMGIQILFPAQPSNDLRAIQKKYPELVIEGGADSQGPMFSNLASVEAGAAEARRCIDDYAGGRRYIAHVSRSGAPNAGHEGFYEEAWRYGHECYDTSADQSGKAVEHR